MAFQAIPGRLKPTSACPSHLGQAKTDLLHSKPSGQGKIDFLPSMAFKSSQNRLPHSKLFQSGRNQLPTFYAIPVRPKPTFSIPSYSIQTNMVNNFFLLSLPCRSWSLFGVCIITGMGRENSLNAD
jgi:hypothetical protein